MKKVYLILFTIIIFVVSSSAVVAINEATNSFLSFNAFNIILIVLTFIFVIVSYNKEGTPKKVPIRKEGYIIYNDLIQRSHYIKCNCCGTQNSGSREICYCCKEKL